MSQRIVLGPSNSVEILVSPEMHASSAITVIAISTSATLLSLSYSLYRLWRFVTVLRSMKSLLS